MQEFVLLTVIIMQSSNFPEKSLNKYVHILFQNNSLLCLLFEIKFFLPKRGELHFQRRLTLSQ